MEKSVTMNLRVNPTLKVQAEDILKQLGIPMSTAVDMYLRQITLVGGIPFAVTLPKAPASVNADRMETEDSRKTPERTGGCGGWPDAERTGSLRFLPRYAVIWSSIRFVSRRKR